MGYFYGSLAVLGWAWTVLLVVAVIVARYLGRRDRRGFDVMQTDDTKH